jgi:hypothetical protein
MVDSLTVSFSSNVDLQPGAITLADKQGDVIPCTLTQLDGEDYKLTFTGAQFVGGSLANGRYLLTIHANGVNVTAAPQLPADQIFSFWRLFGDYYGTASVNNADKTLFSQAYKNPTPAALFAFDYDGNGALGTPDVAAFNKDFGTSV